MTFRLIAAFALAFASAAASAQPTQMETAIFAGGCFWCVESDFDKVAGVVSTTSGYTGGHTQHPTYHEVSAGGTGHAESVEIVFDPKIVSYQKLLQVYWHSVDPTVKDRQFCDVGTQYRSAIFYLDERAEAPGRGIQGADRAQQAVQGADRDRDRQGGQILARRGIPPGLLQEESPALPLLPRGLRPRRAREAALGQRGGPPVKAR